MTDHVIASIDQVTTGWLTAVLCSSGALTRGAVAGFDVEQGRGNWSTSAGLRLRYQVGSQGAMPQRLWLKLVDADLEDEFFGPAEVTYYTRDYVDVEDAPLVRCYSAAYSQEQRRYHLLLDDLSETHVEAASKAPTLEYGLALAEGLAALHARWWGAEGLGAAGAALHSPQHIRGFVAKAAPGVEHILGHVATELQPRWPDAMAALFERLPQALVDRARDPDGFTLIHGDVGHNNVLVPREGDRPLYIVDRQPFDWSLTTWLGVYDLAYAMALDWDADTRRRLELPVLRHYHAWLASRGVRGYSWERLHDDYRLCVALAVTIPVEYCRGGVNLRRLPVWLPMLQRSLAACDDLDCRGLWA